MIHTSMRKVYQGVADRRQMYRMFDRHAQRPNRFSDGAASLYCGEWFAITKSEHDYMLDILPPLFQRCDMFALREFLTGSITSVFFSLHIDGCVRHFHGYCDLSDKGAPDRMRATILKRETAPMQTITREECLEHIWSATHDEYRGYADWRFPRTQNGKRIVQVYGRAGGGDFKVLDQLTDREIVAKLPVHLRSLCQREAA
ncbi:DUF1419 domain-containing protein [Brucella intermedia]|uniref:DUF1419 domain-containing protein n=1 Tax=Brucella TaxID=234 RepID=UPI0009461AB6|nr:DUF1419 domain-containing protein [Brucella intermedia]